MRSIWARRPASTAAASALVIAPTKGWPAPACSKSDIAVSSPRRPWRSSGAKLCGPPLPDSPCCVQIVAEFCDVARITKESPDRTTHSGARLIVASVRLQVAQNWSGFVAERRPGSRQTQENGQKNRGGGGRQGRDALPMVGQRHEVDDHAPAVQRACRDPERHSGAPDQEVLDRIGGQELPPGGPERLEDDGVIDPVAVAGGGGPGGAQGGGEERPRAAP